MPPKSKPPRANRSAASTPPTAQPAPTEQAAAPDTSATSSNTPVPPTVTLVPVSDLRDSRLLSVDRLPSMRTMRQCLEQVGWAASLCTSEGAEVLDKLAPRERDFALLTASVAIHGVEHPLVVQSTPTGLEILDGHRRRYAAELAGLHELPVQIEETMSDEDAAGYAARANTERMALSYWQRARLAAATRAAQAEEAEGRPMLEKLRRRGAPQRADSAANVARMLGIGYTTAKDYIKITTALNDEVLGKVTPAPAEAHAALGALSFRTLRELAQIEDEAERIQAIRVATKLDVVVKPKKQRVGFEVRSDRKGDYTLRVKRVDRLPLEEAQRLLEFLREEEARVQERIEALMTRHAAKRKQEQRQAA